MLEVHFDPPTVSFIWHHWGKPYGPSTARDGTIYAPTGEVTEMVGNCIARLSLDLKIESLDPGSCWMPGPISAGSLEAVVQNLVKNWEVESHHIEDVKYWQTMKVDQFTAYANNLKCPFSAEKMAKIGPYNMLLGKHPLYNAEAESYDTANEIFKNCFSEGFPWEVLEVHSGPPTVSFTWRHWGKLSGPYRARDGTIYAPTGEVIEMFGNCVARVSADLKIESLELFFDREDFIQKLATGAVLSAGKLPSSSTCLIVKTYVDFRSSTEDDNEREDFFEPPLSDVSKGNGEEIIRDYQPLPGVPWRYGAPPNYEVVNKAYFAGRTKVHAAGSLEAVVQNLVKNWEVESHHIEDVKYWQTMKVDNFTAYANNLKCPFSAEKMAKIGPYNMLLGKHPLYNAEAESYDTANEIFKNCFSEGFPWEVLEVHSGPPTVSFTWRHWGKLSGPYRARDGTIYAPTGEVIEMFGNCVARVAADLKIESLELFFDREDFIQKLAAGAVF
eukprot:gene18849-19170_t